jgi:5-methylthioadenosine/S-adenosylhomocysteine deaminase
MPDRLSLQRRKFMHGMGGIAMLAAMPSVGHAASDASSVSSAGAPPSDVLIRGGTVLSMDDAVGDLAQGDVLIRDGRIAAIGSRLEAGDTLVLDAHGTVVLPGLIDTHWHMWNSVARGYAPTASGARFFEAMKKLSAAFTPEDNYVAVRLALAEAINGGITSATNWAHNIRSPAHADAELQAMFESGMSGRFLYGYPQDLDAQRTNDFADIERVRKEYFAGGRGLVDLGVAIRGPERTPASTWRREVQFARERGLPFSVHVAVTRDVQKQRSIEQMHAAGFLDARAELVHATHANDEDFRTIVASGSQVVITPFTEMRVGYGITPVKRMLDAGIAPTIGNDTTVLSGNADLFGVMRAVLSLGNGQAENELALSSRRVLRMATIDAARNLGMADRIGSLAVGKQADVIVLDTRQLASAPLTDPFAFVTEGAQPACVRDVIASGRFLKRDGKLTRVDAGRLVDDANEAWARLRRRA